MPASAVDSLPVLVVGAGPTGLTLATVLARSGIPVRLVERKPSLSRYTKATNVMQRNQELLAALDLTEPLAAVGGHMRRLMVHAYGKAFGPRTMHLAESPYPDVILCGQHNFEAVVARGLADAGVAVEFDTALTGLAQDAAGATATLVRGGRAETTETARFAYVVGCDGHAGPTRTFTRLDFQPARTGVAIRQVDCALAWRRLPTMEQMWLFYFDRGFAVVVPLPGGVHRVLTVEPVDAVPAREPRLDEMQGALRVAADDPSVVLSRPEWFSYTDLAMGLAPALRDGRVFLAGDAGNPVLPNGGQGMNTGVADAFDLGWKLAGVLRHGGPDALLDTYHEERHAVRAALQRAQYNSLKYTTLSTPAAMRAAFRLLAEPLLNAGGEQAMARAFSELGLHTRASSLTLDGVGRRGRRAGERALDAAVVARDGTPVALYDRVYRGGWTLLAFTGRAPHAESAAVLDAIARLGRDDLVTAVVTTESRTERPASAAAILDVLYDLDEEAHRRYAADRALLFLVRPDGRVAVRVRPAHAQRLRAYLARWVPDASQAFAGAGRGHAATMTVGGQPGPPAPASPGPVGGTA